jgi:hypothetical protein
VTLEATTHPLALQADAVRRRLARWGRRIALSSWTPVILAVAACVSILAGSGTAVLQVRLAEMAQARAGADVSSGQAARTGLPGVLADLTVAPDDVRPISMDAARAWNAALPFSDLPIQAARPFIMPPDRIADYARALDCLTAAVYYEAASETALGQAAVAQVVINRMRHPAFPKTICGVVFQGQERTTGCQFSFTCDGAMARIPSAAGWARARATAAAALNGRVAPEVGMATHYHTDWVAPYWAERLVKMRQIDTHIFYRWTGAWGLPGAFSGAHAGAEPVIAKLAAVATYVEELPPVVDAGLAIEPDLGPALPLAAVPRLAVEPTEPTPGETLAEVAAPAPVEVAAPPPAPPAILANPLAAPTAAPQRRSRIATPR